MGITKMKVDPPPNDEEINKKREPRWIIDPKDVQESDEIRIQKWGLSIANKYEYLFDFNKYNHKEIVAYGDVRPEEIDIPNIYNFKNLNWIIQRWNDKWALRLLSMNNGRNKLLWSAFYATLEDKISRRL